MFVMLCQFEGCGAVALLPQDTPEGYCFGAGVLALAECCMAAGGPRPVFAAF